MIKNNLVVLNPKTFILNPLNMYDKQIIENRKKYTYYNKIIGKNENENKNKIKNSK